MIKSELVGRLAELNPHLPASKVERVVNTILGRITQALAAGQRVELRDFGTFAPHLREAHTNRNPRNGAPVAVEAKANVHFKPGKGITDRLNHHPITPGRKARPLLRVPRERGLTT